MEAFIKVFWIWGSSMNKNSAPKSYGPKYQAMCAKVAREAGCKGNEMGILFCLFMQSGLWDWDTGQTTREISHMDLCEEMGGLSYNTVQKSIAALRKAGVLDYADYRGRGVVWADGSGHANRYKLPLPPIDPSQNLGGGVPKKRVDPLPKNGDHYHTSIYPYGKADAARCGEGHKVSGADQAPETRRGVTFSQLVTREGYSEARRLWNLWGNEALRAAENDEGSKFAAE